MVLPKSIKIDGVVWKVVEDPSHDGGSSKWDSHVMEIGTKNKWRVPETLLHEVMEVIYENRGYRYSTWMDTEPRFITDHKEFSAAIMELASVFEFKLRRNG